MPFVKVNVAAKVKAGVFKVSTVQMRKVADFKLQISMPHAEFMKHFGNAERVDIAFGFGEDLGKMLITAAADGAFKPTAFKSAMVIRLPVLDFTPQAKFEGADPERTMTKDGLVVTLPDWFSRWRDILKARETVHKQSRAEVMQRVGKIGA